MRYCRSFLWAACTLLWFIAPVCAQTPTTAITGIVRDSLGTQIPNAVVAAQSISTGYEYASQSDAAGRYWLRALPPGRYEVTARTLGFRAVTRQNVTLFVGQTGTLDFVLPEAAVRLDPLVGVGEQQLTQTTEADISFVIERDQIDILPEESRAFLDLALLAPGATHMPGAEMAASPNGVGVLNSQYLGVLLDGGSLIGGEANDFMGGVPLLAIQEFEVLTGSYSAEFGQAASGVVNAVSRRGSNQLSVEGFGLFRHRRINALGEFEQTKPDFNRTHWGVAIGGPILRDRTHFFLAVERKVENTFATVETGGIWPQYQGTFKTPFQDNLLFARIDHRLSDAHELTIRYAGDISDRRGGIGGTSAEEHGVDRRMSLHSALIAHRGTFGSTLNELRLHVMRQEDRMARITEGPALSYPSLWRGGNEFAWDIVNYRVQLLEKLSVVTTGATGTHRVTVGAQASVVDVDDVSATYSNGQFTFGDDSDTQPSEVLIAYSPAVVDETNVQLAAFAEDEWSPTPNLTLSIGLRYDIETNGTNQGYISPDADTLDFVSAAPRSIDKNNLAPRLGFAWDPRGDGKTVVRGAFGIFYNQSFAIAGMEETRYKIAWLMDPGTTDVGELGLDPDTLPVNPWGFARDIQTPFTHQYSLGFEHTLPNGITVGLDGLLVQGRNLWVTRMLLEGHYYQHLNAGESEGKMLFLHLSKKLASGTIDVHYTLADRRATADWFHEYVPVTDPTVEDFPDELGPVEWDERHRLVAVASVRLPFEFEVGFKGVYSSPRPYNAVIGIEWDVINQRPPGEGRNARRGPDYFNVDVGLSRVFVVGAARLAAVANIYNLLNRTNFRSNSVQEFYFSPLFGQPLEAYAKRQAEVGVRVSF